MFLFVMTHWKPALAVIYFKNHQNTVYFRIHRGMIHNGTFHHFTADSTHAISHSKIMVCLEGIQQSMTWQSHHIHNSHVLSLAFCTSRVEKIKFLYMASYNVKNKLITLPLIPM